MLEKHELKYALRVVPWVTRFITNCKTPKKLTGPLTAIELENVKWGWIRRVQWQATTMPNYPQIKSSLNLQPNLGRTSGVPRAYPRKVPHIPARRRHVCQKVSETGALRDPARGRRANNLLQSGRSSGSQD